MSRRLITVPGVGNPALYAGATVHGDLIWTAGQVPWRDGVEQPDSMADQVRIVIENLERTLETCGGGLDTLIKVNSFLTTLDDFEEYNRVYVEMLAPHGLPPRTTVEIVRFPPPMKVEIEAVAHVR